MEIECTCVEPVRPIAIMQVIEEDFWNSSVTRSCFMPSFPRSLAVLRLRRDIHDQRERRLKLVESNC